MCPARGCNVTGQFLNVFVSEMLMTLLFSMTVVAIYKYDGARYMPINAIAVGVAYWTAIIMTNGVSGGVANPAVAIV